MTAIIAMLLSNKFFLIGLGCLTAAAGLFLKGYQSGNKAAKQSEAVAQQNMNEKLQKTEAENQNIDAQREKNNAMVSAVNAIPKLIELWRNLNKQTPSDPTKKD